MSDFLYPFIDGGDQDPAALVDDLAQSARDKVAISAELTRGTLARTAETLAAAAAAIAERFDAGGRMFAFGNGGSSTDAAALAALFAAPPSGPSRPARALVADSAVLTALGNDVGFELVFSRQLIAHAAAGDIAVGLSTSGNSANLLRAFDEAAARGMTTVGIAGYSGGEMGRSASVQHCLVVDADSVHRIQEAQAALCFELWRRVDELSVANGACRADSAGAVMRR